IWPEWSAHAVWVALAPVIALTAVNLMGIVAGKFAQNALSMLKVLGLGAIVVAALWAGTKPQAAKPQAAAVAPLLAAPDVGVALLFVLYAYGGCVLAPYVAAEVRDQRRNMPRALILGIAGITLIYIAVNA